MSISDKLKYFLSPKEREIKRRTDNLAREQEQIKRNNNLYELHGKEVDKLEEIYKGIVDKIFQRLCDFRDMSEDEFKQYLIEPLKLSAVPHKLGYLRLITEDGRTVTIDAAYDLDDVLTVTYEIYEAEDKTLPDSGKLLIQFRCTHSTGSSDKDTQIYYVDHPSKTGSFCTNDPERVKRMETRSESTTMMVGMVRERFLDVKGRMNAEVVLDRDPDDLIKF